MKRACVVGQPVEKSLSPAIFSHLSSRFQKEFEYTKVATDHFDNFISKFIQSSDSLGCNITFPLKEQAANWEHPNLVISKEVQFLQAANVFKIQDGRFYLHNTDWLGFQNSLSFQPQRVLLLGFGSTTQAVLYALGKMKVHDVTIRSRRAPELQKFKTLFPNMSIQTVASGSYDLIVNTTPAQAELDSDFLNFGTQDQALYYDVNYFDSYFLDGKLKKQDGLSMLIYQALETWEIWFGKLSSKNETHNELYKILRSK